MVHAVYDTTIDGLPATVLASPHAELAAAFAPDVGMVGCSLRHRGDELLGQRKGLRAYAETGSTMGIPLLHPWANRLEGRRYRAGTDGVELAPERSPLRLDGNGLPIHGLLAASPHWRVVAREAGDEGALIAAELDFGAHPELLAAFPFPHVLRLEARLAGAELTVRLALRTTGVVPVPVAFGFHPYLRLPGAPRREWRVELPVRRRALVDERGIPTGELEEPPFRSGLLGELDLDDLFPELEEPARFTVEGGGRRLSVELREGYPVAQVYSPPDADFVCFEPMTAPTNALVTGDRLPRVPPGGDYEAAFAVAVE